MPRPDIVYTDKGSAPEGNALFDMLTKQNTATFQHGLDMEKQAKGAEFDRTLEILRSGNQAEREKAAFERHTADQLLTGKAIGDYTGQQAVAQAGQGHVFPGLVERQNDPDVERVTGHPLFTPRAVDPRAAALAHGDLQTFLTRSQTAEEARATAAAKLKENLIGQEHADQAQSMAADFDAVGEPGTAEFLRNIQPGMVSKEKYFDVVGKLQTELSKVRMRKENAKTFADARKYSADQSRAAREYAAQLAQRGRVDKEAQRQLSTYGTALNQDITKHQALVNSYNMSAENAPNDETRQYYLGEAWKHQNTIKDLISSKEQVSKQLGRAIDLPDISNEDNRRMTQEMQQVIDALRQGKKIRGKSWQELNAKEKALVQETHKTMFPRQ